MSDTEKTSDHKYPNLPKRREWPFSRIEILSYTKPISFPEAMKRLAANAILLLKGGYNEYYQVKYEDGEFYVRELLDNYGKVADWRADTSSNEYWNGEGLGAGNQFYIFDPEVYHKLSRGLRQPSHLSADTSQNDPMWLVDLFPLLERGDRVEFLDGSGRKAILLYDALRWVDSVGEIGRPVSICKENLATKWRLVPRFNLLDEIKKGVRTFKTRDGQKVVDVDYKPSRATYEKFVGTYNGHGYSCGIRGNVRASTYTDSLDIVDVWTDKDDENS